MRRRVSLAGIATVLACGCLHPPGRHVEVGAVSVQVTEKETGRAIGGVPVALALEAVRLRFEREKCKERGRCTGVPDETDVAVANFGDEEDANSFLFRNPVEAYRGVILERYVAGEKGEEWRRTWGVFRVERLDSRPELGGAYEARLVPAK